MILLIKDFTDADQSECGMLVTRAAGDAKAHFYGFYGALQQRGMVRCENFMLFPVSNLDNFPTRNAKSENVLIAPIAPFCVHPLRF